MDFIHFKNDLNYFMVQTKKEFGDMKNINNINKLLKNEKLKNKILIRANQTHSTNIACIKENYQDIYDNTDGFITNRKDLALMAYFADCTPIFLITKDVYALIHAGWRGSSDKILQKAISLFKSEFNIDAKDIKMFFGVSISAKNYEIKQDTVNILKEKLNFDNMIIYENNKIYLDVKKINRNIAISCGILENNIFDNKYCSFDDDFFSYRENKTSERSACIITSME